MSAVGRDLNEVGGGLGRVALADPAASWPGARSAPRSRRTGPSAKPRAERPRSTAWSVVRKGAFQAGQVRDDAAGDQVDRGDHPRRSWGALAGVGQLVGVDRALMPSGSSPCTAVVCPGAYVPPTPARFVHPMVPTRAGPPVILTRASMSDGMRRVEGEGHVDHQDSQRASPSDRFPGLSWPQPPEGRGPRTAPPARRPPAGGAGRGGLGPGAAPGCAERWGSRSLHGCAAERAGAATCTGVQTHSRLSRRHRRALQVGVDQARGLGLGSFPRLSAPL